MLRMRKLKANKQIERIKVNVVVAKPMLHKLIDSMMKANVSGTLLSYRETSHPEIGRPINELMGMKSKIVPSSASL